MRTPLDPRLSQLISDYQARIADALLLLKESGVTLPTSNTEWVGIDVPENVKGAEIRFHKHGFGCAVITPRWSVDFDFGDKGQIDGFDLDRLKWFALKRLSEYDFLDESEVNRAFEAAKLAGELVYSGNILFYLARKDQ
jgi:hypothetical protein